MSGLVEQMRSIGSMKKIVKKRRRGRRIKKVATTALQKLFIECCDVFTGGVAPSPSDVMKLSHILDAMRPEDVGLSNDLHFFKSKCMVESNPRVTYTTIYKCDYFSLCIFFLPPKAVIPLHNHPGMTVFTKLLLGTIHIKAYDWIDDPEVKENGKKQAQLKTNTTYTAPCSSRVLYPTSGGNIHQFKAITACAVLDVLGPPYSKHDARDCSYYRHMCLDEQDTAHFLEEIEAPVESQMDVIQYLGPQVLASSHLL